MDDQGPPHNVVAINGQAGTGPRSTDRNTAGPVQCSGRLSSTPSGPRLFDNAVEHMDERVHFFFGVPRLFEYAWAADDHVVDQFRGRHFVGAKRLPTDFS